MTTNEEYVKYDFVAPLKKILYFIVRKRRTWIILQNTRNHVWKKVRIKTKFIITINISKWGYVEIHKTTWNISLHFLRSGLGDAFNWEKAIKDYMCNPCCKKLDLIYTISKFCTVQRSDYLTLQQQCSVLPSIPNFHRWKEKKSSDVKKDECFVPQKKSSRNQLIKICTLETTDYDLVGGILLSVVNNEFAHAISSPHIKNKSDEHSPSLNPD